MPGAGLYNFLSNPTYENCIVSGNIGGEGASCYNTNQSEPVFIGCTLVNNTSRLSCGGVYNVTSNPVFLNSVCANNYDIDGNLTNSVIDTNNGLTTCYNSAFNDAADGANNLIVNSDDLDFLHELLPDDIPSIQGDYNMHSSSALKDAGDNQYVNTTSDLNGNDRITNDFVDIGAYEFSTGTSKVSENVDFNLIKVYPNPTNGLLKFNFKDATGKRIELYDISGELLIDCQIKTQIDISDFRSGVYIIYIKSDRIEKGCFSDFIVKI